MDLVAVAGLEEIEHVVDEVVVSQGPAQHSHQRPVANLLCLEDRWSAPHRDRGLPLGIRNMAKLLEEIHPGEILLEDFMKPMGISARQLAADIDVSPSRISELVNGQRPITADTALRLGLFFGMEPRFWLNLQSEYDIRVADRELRAKLSPRIRVFQPAVA
jgi:addiction module HigA family antidote